MALQRPAGEGAAGSIGLHRDLIELGGAGAEFVELSGSSAPSRSVSGGVVRVGVHRGGRLPHRGLNAFDILLTTSAGAPFPWVSLPDDALRAAMSRLETRIARNPVAAAVAAQVLRVTQRLSFDNALTLESLGYSMLLASSEFRSWRLSTPVRQRTDESKKRIRIDKRDSVLSIRLDRAAKRNAFDAAMRDALTEALSFALNHPDKPQVALSGEGPSFSAGGDLDEFGTADDAGWAHMVRTLRSPAGLSHALGGRLTVLVHGACVGAGIEIPAAAARVVAKPGAVFRLPEVSMGLIPGAGGTVSIPRRIGRHRACYMAISGADIDLATALAWGLVDAEDAS